MIDHRSLFTGTPATLVKDSGFEAGLVLTEPAETFLRLQRIVIEKRRLVWRENEQPLEQQKKQASGG